jgi:hypothetical protein
MSAIACNDSLCRESSAVPPALSHGDPIYPHSKWDEPSEHE